jgi:hypothetical protein
MVAVLVDAGPTRERPLLVGRPRYEALGPSESAPPREFARRILCDERGTLKGYV